MRSALYVGTIRHRRYERVAHAFRYKLFMILLDLDELDYVFHRRWFWSTRKPAVAWFRRQDYFGNPDEPLAESARNAVEDKLGWRPVGTVRLLTNLRYFGIRMNPVSFYLCYDRSGDVVEALILEVTNTPWGERHIYVVDTRDGCRDITFDKAMHVSPFFEMDYTYRCRFVGPGKRFAIHIENWRDGRRAFDATLSLHSRPLSGHQLATALVRYPVMTLQIVAAIYWEALNLYRKGARYCPHPDTLGTSQDNEAEKHERTGHA